MKNLDKAYEILEPFVDYCLSFYGEDGLYDMGATKDQVTAATLHHLHTTEHEFMGDSFDLLVSKDVWLLYLSSVSPAASPT